MSAITHRFIRGIRADTDVQYQLAGAPGRWNDLHLTQGELSSACGCHSLLLAIMILQGIPRSSVLRLAQVKRGPLHELWKLASAQYFDGVEAEDLVAYLQPFSPALDCQVLTTASPSRIGRAVDAAITAGQVPLLRLDSRQWAHYVCIVGLERMGSELAPRALLTLDSSHPAPWIAPFNGRLDLQSRPPSSVRLRKPYLLPYRYAGGDAWAVRLRGLVIVRKVPQAQPP